MTPEEYDRKREARYDRLLAAARKAEAARDNITGQARDMASAIPFGQPILVGHHSEGADRRYRARIESKFRRGYELHQRSEELRSRAESARNNQAIFSDDPRAEEKVADKIARLEERQRRMVEANKLVRKGDRAGLLAMGFSDKFIEHLFEPDFSGRAGFPGYELTNNSANIRRIKARLVDLQSHSNDVTTVTTIGQVRIVDSIEEGRLQVFFPCKPSEAVRSDLSAHGFHWSRTNGAWQRFRGKDAEYWAKQIVEKHYAAQASIEKAE